MVNSIFEKIDFWRSHRDHCYFFNEIIWFSQKWFF